MIKIDKSLQQIIAVMAAYPEKPNSIATDHQRLREICNSEYLPNHYLLKLLAQRKLNYIKDCN